jgi:hypothetical protein
MMTTELCRCEERERDERRETDSVLTNHLLHSSERNKVTLYERAIPRTVMDFSDDIFYYPS